MEMRKYGHAEVPDWDDECYHSLARVFPKPTEDDYQRLKQSIRDHGQSVPILVYQGHVVDGRC